MSLARPLNSHQGIFLINRGPKYGASITSRSTYNSLARSKLNTSHAFSDGYLLSLKSQTVIPFLQMNNSLQLYLKLHIFQNDERTIAWIPGSFVEQGDPFVSEPKATSLFSLISSVFSEKLNKSDIENIHPLLCCPGYFLLTNLYIYIFTPRFRLASLKTRTLF